MLFAIGLILILSGFLLRLGQYPNGNARLALIAEWLVVVGAFAMLVSFCIFLWRHMP